MAALSLLGGLLCGALPPLSAGDWPQILGPGRNGQALGEQLPDRWPSGGPPLLWRRPLGTGYAGPVAADQRVVAFHRVENLERLEAFHAGSGQLQWRVDFPARYRGGVDPDPGPRAAPLIHQDRLFAFGAAGSLHCVSLATGERHWSREAYAEFGGDEGYFGAGSTPIVSQGALLVNVGGRDGAGLVAFSLKDGQTIWQATDERASYSSPTEALIGGRRRVIFVTRYNVAAVDPLQGTVLFRLPFGQRGPTVNAATPLVFGDYLFVSASYGVGALLARLANDKAEIVWSNDQSMSSQYATCVYHQGYLYGAHGREDVGRAELRCLEALSGQVQWSDAEVGVAHLILAGDKLLVLTTQGELLLALASPERFQRLDRARVSTHATRALPALAGGRLYLRDNPPGGGGELKCYAVSGPD